ncbi:MAG TPA: thioredoxin domain-containing protein [Candidatus Angelobacter sp.]|nr:thioredoxin domain-containing protein [Candidatus Angelobacter sp.]
MVRFLSLFLLTATLIAQQAAPTASELDRRIERQVRAYTEVPVDAQISLGARSPSKFNGYDTLPVSIEANGVKKDLNFLIAKDDSKLLYVTEIDLKQDPYAHNMQRINTTGRPWRGAESAKVSIVVYDDFECPFCAKMYVTLMNEVMVHYRDRVKIVMKDFPLVDAHPWAMRAAIDSHCLADQSLAAYWAFADYVHTHQGDVSAKVNAAGSGVSAVDAVARDIGQKDGLKTNTLQACLALQDPGKVESSLAEGKLLGVSATPTMFINGERVEGGLTAEQLRTMLDDALKDASTPQQGQ